MRTRETFVQSSCVSHLSRYFPLEYVPTDASSNRNIYRIIAHNETDGNKLFRDVVAKSLDEYMGAMSRTDKGIVVQDIIQSIKSMGCRFLKQDNFAGTWKELSPHEEKKKVGHAIRDALGTSESRMTNFHTKSIQGERRLNEVSSSDKYVTKIDNNKRSSQDLDCSNQQHQSPASLLDNKNSSIFPEQVFPLHYAQNDGLAVARKNSNSADPIVNRCHYSELLPTSPAFYEQQQNLPQIDSSMHQLKQPIEDEFADSHSQVDFSMHQLKQPIEDEFADSHFLTTINEVLGPLSSDAEDPLDHDYTTLRKKSTR
jgi:hypothetical protein